MRERTPMVKALKHASALCHTGACQIQWWVGIGRCSRHP